ncbi:LADA_0F04280g1_1 [Lachancea dasiensis]|uniref:Pre-mRNA-splicing factor SLU7 n=1 Tax=Lachancea dasiensis TaxID=1072105 RepID=A0A1G4JJ24_9SACH|nr:LADA_0F04280g1_1 [Lachancea dasiensis]
MSKRQENAHIPKYIRDQPWFYKAARGGSESEDYLAHHRRANSLKNADSDLDIDNNAEPKVGRGIQDTYERATPRQGSENCRNCGGAGHAERDCLEAPRKRKATHRPHREVGSERRADSGGNWDARKDRWYGYDGEEYDRVLRRQQDELRQHEQSQPAADAVDTDEEIELAALGLYKQEMTGFIAHDDARGSRLRASVRLREDRAAYLNDIGSDTLNYDPKSRLYKTDELGEVDSETNMFHRHLTGESLQLSELNRFARERTLQSGIRDEVENAAKTSHVLVANPTKYELLRRHTDQPTDREHDAAARESSSNASAKRISGTKQTEEHKSQLLQKYG